MTTTQQKAHATNTGLTTILGDHSPATEQALQDDKLLSKLYHLLEDDVLLDIQYEIAPKTGDHAGVYQDTTGTIALPLQNKDYKTVSLLCIRPNAVGHQQYHVTDTSQPCAAFLGVPTAGHEVVMTDNLADGLALVSYFICDKVTVLVSPTKALFIDTIKHFAQDAKVTIFPDISHKDKISKQLAGHNVKIIIPDLPMLSHVENNVSYAEILSYPDTQVIDLEKSGWAMPKAINHTLPPVTSVTKNMLPEPLYNYAINSAERLSVPLEFVAVPLIVELGSVIGTKVAIMPKRYDDWDIVPNLWGAIIGQP
jgi:hypothetical protein